METRDPRPETRGRFAFIGLMAVIVGCAFLVACSRSRGFDADYRAAESRVGVGDTDGALAGYRALVERYPGDPRGAVVQVRIGDLYATVLGNVPLALKAYARAISDFPLSDAAMQARERRAHLFQQNGNIEGAIEDYSVLLKHAAEASGRARYRVLLVGAYLAQRNFRQARIEVVPLIDDPATPPEIREQALFAAAESYFLEDRPTEAVPFYRELLREFPETALASEAELHLATCIEELGYLGTARDVTRDAARDYPNKGVIDARLKSLKDRGSQPLEAPGLPDGAEARAPAVSGGKSER